MKYVDVVRSPGSAIRVFTSSETLANQLKINEIGEIGELVKKIQMDGPKVGKIWKLVRHGQGEEDEFIKEAREKELKYLRKLGVNEKVDERAAVAKYNVTPVDTKWVDTDIALEGGAGANPFTNCCWKFKFGDRPDLYAGALPLEAFKAILCIAASHSPEFSLMHVDVSCAYFHARAQRPVLVKLPAEEDC